MSKITNTEKDDRKEWALFGAAPGAIEAQEARGQQELVASEVLPTEGLQAVAGATGIEIVAPVAGDPLFTSVRLPAGWSKRPTNHAMWSDLVDDKDRKRAAIFYKAAFYDRKANVRAVPRFTIQTDYDRRDASVMRVEDCGAVAFTSAAHPYEEKNWESRDNAESAARAECLAWLTERGYPEFGNPARYWDVA